MWTKIIDLIIGWVKEKPRKDVVSKIMNLREAMKKCHEAYGHWLSDKDKGNTHRGLGDPYIAWAYSLQDLASAIRDVDDVIAIFSPEAKGALYGYQMHEWHLADAAQIRHFRRELDQSLELLSLRVLGTEETEKGETEGGIEADFTEAMDKLDQFIRTTFRIEEVDASRHKLIF